jgi:hypothetical protein
VRQTSPGGIIWLSDRPFKNGRPYSIDKLAPSMVHSVRTWGLPPEPDLSSVVFCATRLTAEMMSTQALDSATLRFKNI